MEVGKATDIISWIALGIAFGIAYTLTALTYDEVKRRDVPCPCAKLKKEVKTND